MNPKLNPGAVYGGLPFDHFALALWDYHSPLYQDQEQWDLLAKKWLSMSHVDRSPYWEIHHPLDSPHPDAPYLPTKEQIDRVLAPHQTSEERNVSLLVAIGGTKPVWIRTCYAPDLQGAYEDILEAAAELDEVDPELVLENESLYGAFDKDCAKILLRMPLLPDTVPYCGGDPEQDDGPYHDEPPDDERLMPLFDASRREKQVVYLIDEEALRNKVVKLLYLDIHGHAVWHNTIAPEHIWEREATYCQGGALIRLREGCYGDDPRLQPGAHLVYW